jgi:hypothetical protein
MHMCTGGVIVKEFLMSWNRRIPESVQFFDLMNAAGECCVGTYIRVCFVCFGIYVCVLYA